MGSGGGIIGILGCNVVHRWLMYGAFPFPIRQYRSHMPLHGPGVFENVVSVVWVGHKPNHQEDP